MRLTLLLSLLVAVSVQGSDYRQALALYESGMYERARTMFEAVPNDPLYEGYVVLCALKMDSEDYPELLSAYSRKYPSSTLAPSIAFQNAIRLFDREHYEEAILEFKRVTALAIPEGQKAEMIFKQGYCYYMTDRPSESLSEFARLDAEYDPDYSAPAWYLSGLMTYNVGDFPTAEAWFKKSVADPRFVDQSRFYIVDCEFNQKNYSFVIEEGEKIFDSVPKERRERLARIISESYLVEGEKQKAREYFDSSSKDEMTRSDYFYAASVMYGVEDYAGAVENFLRMTDRSDSLGQIANYQLANSYLELRNKVAALDAFKDAAMVDYNPDMTEDAYFNYAKLAFDLNKDTEGFSQYIKRWFTKKRGEQIYSYMALAALVDRDYAGAVDAYDKIDELEPDMRTNYAKANYLRAEQLIRGGSWRDAVPFLQASSYYIPKNEKFNQLSRYWLAEAYYRSGNYSEARKLFTELFNGSSLQGMSEGKMLSYDVAYCFLNEKDYSSAAKWFDICSSSGPASLKKDAMTRRADCDFVNRDYKAAVGTYGKLADAFGGPDNIYPLYRQALSYGLSGDKKQKVATLKKIQDADTSVEWRDEALYELGRTQMDLKSHNDAVATFHKLHDSTSSPEYAAKSLIGLGMVNRNVSNYEKALEYYKEVVSGFPGTQYAEDALLSIESIYRTTKQPQKYLEYVEQNSIAKDDNDKEKMYFNAAEQVYLAGNYQQTVNSVQKYLEMFPQGDGKSQLKFYLAESLLAIGEKEKACDCYSEVAEEGGNDSFVESARLSYARLSFELERYSQAYRAYSSLLSTARLEQNRLTASAGMMRSAYKGKDYASAISAARTIRSYSNLTDNLGLEAEYILAKSLLATSKRDEAIAIFKELAKSASTPEGAEARFFLIQDSFDRAKFDEVETMVYDFAQVAGDQSYWLAKAFIVLGDSFLERGRKDQAKATYQSIRDGYEPSSGTVDDVTESLKIRIDGAAATK